MATGGRPLSPHLQVYRPQLTSILSIFHRMTGVALWGGTLFLVWWLAAAAGIGTPFAMAQEAIGHWIGRLLLFGFSFSLFYHLCNGIRHLFWDAGYGYELPVLAASGWAVLLVSGALTVASWVWGYVAMGVL